MIHAAYDLGASQFQMFKEIMLPYLTPSIIAGYFMAFTYSLDDFAVTFFVTGNGFFNPVSRDLLSCTERDFLRNQCPVCSSLSL